MTTTKVTSSTVVPTTTEHRPSSSETFHNHLMVYIGVSIAAGIIICVIIILCILLYKRGTFRRMQYGRRGTRRLFLRGFSTVSQRGVIDSTGEFEMVHTGNSMSVSSEDGSERRSASNVKQTPRKPDRQRSRTPSANAQYENVTLDGNAGFVVRKTPSMNSTIQYIDGTLGSHISEKDEDLDDVFIDSH